MHNIKYAIKRLLELILPVKKNKIVFINFAGKGYGCNPKYIAEELISRNKNYDLVWLLNDMNQELPEQIRKVKFNSWKSFIELITAKVWISNVKYGINVRKKRNQFYLQTWHASFGLKCIEADARGGMSSQYIKTAKKDAAQTDLMISNNDFRKKQYETSFWYSGIVKKCGIPRNAILFQNNSEKILLIKENLNIDVNKKIVLYAPTFRSNNENISNYIFDFQKFILALEKRFDGNFIMMIRLHPHAAVNIDDFITKENIINVTNYPDMQELLAISDILVTDYSSCMFDFSFTYKPVFLYANDLENYTKYDRDFMYDIKLLPFPLSKTSEELIESVALFKKAEYVMKCEEFFRDIGLEEDGEGAKEIANIIDDVILGEG